MTFAAVHTGAVQFVKGAPPRTREIPLYYFHVCCPCAARVLPVVLHSFLCIKSHDSRVARKDCRGNRRKNSLKVACRGRIEMDPAAVDFRLSASVRGPGFGPRSRTWGSNPDPSQQRCRKQRARPLGQAGAAGSKFRVGTSQKSPLFY